MKHILLLVVLSTVVAGTPLFADAAGKCGRGIVLEIRVRDSQSRGLQDRRRVPILNTLVVSFDRLRYTAESSNGRILLFGPFVAGVAIDLCVRDQVLVLTHPRDLDPEVMTYEMKVVKTESDPLAR
jgi:hypothetical protein